MMDMMDSTTAVVMLMVLLIVGLVGVLIAVRLIGGRSFNDDHDG
jgi:NADH:ubiquinone oxidoreductase subunit 3 (subunit A)